MATDGNALNKLANILPEIDPEMVQRRSMASRTSEYYKKNPEARRRRLKQQAKYNKKKSSVKKSVLS